MLVHREAAKPLKAYVFVALFERHAMLVVAVIALAIGCLSYVTIEAPMLKLSRRWLIGREKGT